MDGIKFRPLLRYQKNQQLSIADSISEKYLQLRMNLAPIRTATGPFFRDVHHCKVQHLKQAIICRKNFLVFSHFSELAIESFYHISCVDKCTHCLRILEICGYLNISYNDKCFIIDGTPLFRYKLIIVRI